MILNAWIEATDGLDVRRVIEAGLLVGRAAIRSACTVFDVAGGRLVEGPCDLRRGLRRVRYGYAQEVRGRHIDDWGRDRRGRWGRLRQRGWCDCDRCGLRREGHVTRDLLVAGAIGADDAVVVRGTRLQRGQRGEVIGGQLLVGGFAGIGLREAVLHETDRRFVQLPVNDGARLGDLVSRQLQEPGLRRVRGRLGGGLLGGRDRAYLAHALGPERAIDVHVVEADIGVGPGRHGGQLGADAGAPGHAEIAPAVIAHDLPGLARRAGRWPDHHADLGRGGLDGLGPDGQ